VNSPVIESAWPKVGAHVSPVGYHPPAGELPVRLASAERLFVESHDAFHPTPVGCAELAGIAATRGTTLGAVALGREPGRQNDTEITVYKAMGLATQDMVAANLAYRSAKRNHVGGAMAW
jgi:alanine dehydrogenase